MTKTSSKWIAILSANSAGERYANINRVFAGICDPDGDGLVKEVWFPNRLLPIKQIFLVGLPGNYVPAQV